MRRPPVFDAHVNPLLLRLAIVRRAGLWTYRKLMFKERQETVFGGPQAQRFAEGLQTRILERPETGTGREPEEIKSGHFMGSRATPSLSKSARGAVRAAAVNFKIRKGSGI